MGLRLRLPLAALAAVSLGFGQTVAVRIGGETRRATVETCVEWAVAGEMGAVARPEALKAMAVVARSWIRTNRGRHRTEGFDFCQTTHCQRLDPSASSAAIRRAVEETAGVILWYRGRPAQVFHSADCGGRTASAGEIWPGLARPYLPAKDDPWCLRREPGGWRAEIPWPRLAAALGLPGLRFLAVERRSASGRVLSLRSGRGPVDAETLHLRVGRALGWSLLRSRFYEVESRPHSAVFSGKGEGHGVGLCQKGAMEMAQSGADFREILAFYFPGAAPGVSPRGLLWQRFTAGPVDVDTLDGAPPASLPLAAAAWDEARRRSGLDAPCRPRIREYPDTALFRDATGAGGGLAAVSRGCFVHLHAPARLAAQGRLGPVLLHEMMHVLIEANRRVPLPEWFEEGLAEYLSGGAARAAERARVEALVRRYGRASVLDFLKTGLPQ
jgi:stage II sporulation protein D